MIYLASPYSDPNPEVKEQRFNDVCRAAAELMRRGILIFSPIAHTHPIANFGLPSGWEFWRQFDYHHIETSEQVWVLTLPGWADSVGVSAEVEIAKELGKPVRLVDAGTLVPRMLFPGMKSANAGSA